MYEGSVRDSYYNENENAMGSTKRKRRLPFALIGVLLAICAVLGVICFILSATTVEDGYTGCLYRFGELKSTDVGKGLQFHVPFIESIDKVDMRHQIYEGETTAYTSDGQVVEDIIYSVNYNYDYDKLDYLIKNIGISNVSDRLIAPNVYSFMKNVIGSYKGEVLIQSRSNCQEQVETDLRDYLSQFGVHINSFNLLDLDFEDEFEAAVRAKVDMEQKAQTAKNETVLKQEEASQKIIAAEANAQSDIIAAQAKAESDRFAADAEAYAIQVIQEQLAQSPNYIELQKIQKWNGSFPQIMGDSINPFVTLK